MAYDPPITLNKVTPYFKMHHSGLIDEKTYKEHNAYSENGRKVYER